MLLSALKTRRDRVTAGLRVPEMVVSPNDCAPYDPATSVSRHTGAAAAGSDANSKRTKISHTLNYRCRDTMGQERASVATKTALPTTDASALIPKYPTLPALASAAVKCKACPLWKCGTQTVFGLGPSNAKLVFVGEQPGDQEDLAGKPFVGPAGKLLDRALEESGIDRKKVYVTNAVKHFKWEPRGKRRIHKKPSTLEVAACRPWLEAELSLLTPKLVLALGATAPQTLLGPKVKVK